MDGERLKTTVPVVSPEEAEKLLRSPTDLSPEAAALWTAWAGYAMGERTLTSATAAGFRELCEQWAMARTVYARIQVLGAASAEAEPHVRNYLKLAQRLDGSLARFKLTAFGKPAVSDKPKAAENPWAKVAGK